MDSKDFYIILLIPSLRILYCLIRSLTLAILKALSLEHAKYEWYDGFSHTTFYSLLFSISNLISMIGFGGPLYLQLL